MSRLLLIKGKGIDLRLHMGNGPATPSGGVGGVEEIPRPDDEPLTETVETLRRQEVPVMLNGWANNQPVQRLLNRIEELGKGDPRPVLRLDGPVHDTKLRWLLEDMEYGEVIRRSDGVLMRQALTLRFCEWVAPDQIRIRKRKKKSNQGGGVGPSDFFPYKSRKGDTLHSIAARLLGKPSLYRQLTGAETKNPDKTLEPGTVIRLKG